MNKLIGFGKQFGISVISLVLPALAFAQNIPSPTAPTPSTVPQGTINSLQDVLNTVCIVFSWMFYFLVAIAVIFILVAAFKYLTAGGEAEKVKGAGNTLLYAAVAVGVALLARAVPLIVGSFVGAGTVTSC